MTIRSIAIPRRVPARDRVRESAERRNEPHAQRRICKSITSNPLIYPSTAELAKLPFQKDLGEDELKYSDRWTEVTSS